MILLPGDRSERAAQWGFFFWETRHLALLRDMQTCRSI